MVSHPSFFKGNFWLKYDLHIEKYPNISTQLDQFPQSEHPRVQGNRRLNQEIGLIGLPSSLPVLLPRRWPPSWGLDFYRHWLVISVFKCMQIESSRTASFVSCLFHSKFYSQGSATLFACRNSSFFLFAVLYSFGQICHKLFIHSTANKYLGGFWFEAFRNRLSGTFSFAPLGAHM